MTGRVVVLRGDAAHLPLPDASVHAVVCDPPYALAELPVAKVAEALSAWLGGDRGYVPKTGAGGFMGRKWDDFVPPPAAWDECMRVLKPGGHVLAFAAPRTQDLMGMSIRLAGFEIREGIKWVFGSGYPKSRNVSVDIDKRRDWAALAEFQAMLRSSRVTLGISQSEAARRIGLIGPAESLGGGGFMWFETGLRVPTQAQYAALKKSLRLDDSCDAAFEAAEREVLSESVTSRNGGSWAEQVRSGMFQVGERTVQVTAAASDEAKRWDGWGTALKPAHEPIVFARKPPAGTVAANTIKHGTGALNIAGCRVGAEPRVNNAGGASSLQRVSRVEQGYRPSVTTSRNEASEVVGRWPANVVLSHAADCGQQCAPDCPAAEMDRQSGASTSRIGHPRASARPGDGYGMTYTGAEYADEGGASRFFPVFRYEAKADASERPRLPDGTAWPTVKPVALMRWLVRLVTPPGGVVLDPFCGTGPTGEAAIIEGFDAILLDKDPQAIALTRVRLAKPIQPLMFAPGPAAKQARPEPAASAQDSLFDLGEAS